MTDDSNPGVREAAFQGFAGLLVVLGKPVVNEFFQKLDKHKQKKIEDSIASVVIPEANVAPKPISRTAPVQPRAQPVQDGLPVPKGN